MLNSFLPIGLKYCFESQVVFLCGCGSRHCVASFRHCVLGFATCGSCIGLMTLSAVLFSPDPCVLPLSPCLFTHFFSLDSTLETLSRLTVTIQPYGLVECSLRDKHTHAFWIQILKIIVYFSDSAEVCGHFYDCFMIHEVYWWESTVLIRKCVVALAAALFSVSYAPMLYLSSLLLIAAGRQLRAHPLHT